MIVFASKVGTAPGTSTLMLQRPRLNGLGVQCEPIPGPLTVVAPWSPAAQAAREAEGQEAPGRIAVYENPYQDIPQMKGLGMVLTPPFVTRTLPGAGPWADQDPYYNQEGEVGFYHDTQLGAIPTDFDLATQQCYTPVQSGWISALNGARRPRGLAGALRDTTDAVEALTAHQKRVFWLSAIGTAALVVSTGLGVYTLFGRKR